MNDTCPKDKQEDVELSVSFDINQIGANLAWVITEEPDKRNLYRVHGAHAGSVHMQQCDNVFVRVTGYSGPLDNGQPAEHKFEFKVIGCTLVTVPRLREKGVLYTPSPFESGPGVPAMPSIEIGEFVAAPPPHKLPDGVACRVRVSTQSLLVTEKFGIWEFSLVLTVDITHDDGQVRRRVFRFDPESEVGTGTQSHNL